MTMHFTSEIINALRHRVIEHNAALREAGQGEHLVKLGTLKGLYKRWCNGRDPHVHALGKIDDRLATLRNTLLKAEARDDNGRFTAGGAGPPAPATNQREFYRDVASRQEHRQLSDDNAGYQAAQTQIIPETRYSTFAPTAAGVAGYGYAASLGGASARKPGWADRKIIDAMGGIGRLGGAGVGHATGAGIKGAAQAGRAGVGLINRTLHTTIQRPGPQAGAHLANRIQGSAGEAGRIAGRGLGHAYSLFYRAPGLATQIPLERLIPGRGGKIAGRLAGAGLAAAAFGPAATHGLMHVTTTVGPYLDSLFPRHVQKQMAGFLDSDAVLAKQGELLAFAAEDPALAADLAKIDPTLGLRALRAVASRGASLAGRAANRFLRTAHPSVASHTTGPHAAPLGVPRPPEPGPIGRAAGETVFETTAAKPVGGHPQFHVPRHRLGRNLRVAQHVGGLGFAGAGVGALAGAGGVAAHDLLFDQRHPRDRRGRFTTHRGAAKTGAVVGGAVGIGAGLIAGLVAARRGHANLLAAGLARLGAAAPEMHQAAAEEARNVHARAWAETPKNKRLIPGFKPPGNNQPVRHAHVEGWIKQHAVDVWRKTEGLALQASNPKAWYEYQINKAFETEALRALRRPAGGAKLVTKTGEPVGGSTVALIHTLDETKLTPDQKKLWDDLVQRRQAALDGVEKVYAERGAVAGEYRKNSDAVRARRDALLKDVDHVRKQATALDISDATRLVDIKAFAKEWLKHDIAARSVPAAKEELAKAVKEWEDAIDPRIQALEQEFHEVNSVLSVAGDNKLNDLTQTEREAIVNPFARTKAERFFPAQPDPDNRAALEQAIQDAAAKPFLDEAALHVKDAEAHLNSLIAAQQAALEGQVSKDPLLVRQAHKMAPTMAAWMRQARTDLDAVATGHRAGLSGKQKQIYDWLEAQKNPKQAWQSLKDATSWSSDKAKKSGAWALKHYRPLAGALGIASAYGIIDLNDSKTWNPIHGRRKWARPKGIKIEREWPDAINRPHEAMLGVSFRDHDNRQKLLTGIYMKDAAGSHTILPFGADVEQLRNNLRNRGGGGGGGSGQPRGQRIEVKDRQGLMQKITSLKADGWITQRGPAWASYWERAPAGEAGPYSQEVVNKFYEEHLKRIENVPRESARDAGRYWASLATLFERPESEILSAQERAQLLVGNGNKRRGIFANPQNAFAQPANADTSRVLNQLRNQINVHPMGEAGHYQLMHRAFAVIGDHYKFSDKQRIDLDGWLDQAWTKAHASPPPKHVVAAASQDRADEVVQQLLNEVPHHARELQFQSESAARDMIRAQYTKRVKYLREQHGPGSPDEWTEDSIHNDAVGAAKSALSKMAEDDGSLRKYLTGGSPRQPKQPRLPSATPTMPQNPMPPPIAGSAKPNLATRLDATRQGGQIAGHGLAQAGYELGEGVGHFLPGRLGTIAGMVGGGLGGIQGWNTGQQLGQAAGRKAGDTTQNSYGQPQSEGEAVARLVVPALATMGATHSYKLGQKVGARALPGALGRQIAAAPGAIARAPGAAVRAAGRGIAGAARSVAGVARSAVGRGAATTAAEGIAGAGARGAAAGTFEALGSKIGSGVGQVGGAIAGEVAEPAGGGFVGRWGGRALGTAVGAGAGYLADEAVGYLYRHLGSYGTHVPDIAAQSLGVHPHARQRAAARAALHAARAGLQATTGPS